MFDGMNGIQYGTRYDAVVTDADTYRRYFRTPSRDWGLRLKCSALCAWLARHLDELATTLASRHAGGSQLPAASR
jgi:hypothetical protein